MRSVPSNEAETFSEATNRIIRNWKDIRGENLLDVRTPTT
nr:MAG TPA: hypothetical protein [Caudoviricetes sp.]